MGYLLTDDHSGDTFLPQQKVKLAKYYVIDVLKCEVIMVRKLARQRHGSWPSTTLSLRMGLGLGYKEATKKEEKMADQEMLKKSPSQEKYGRVQSAIKILFLVVFMGWILIWIILPTNVDKEKWLPELRTKTNSTYYGIEGASFLIYTSPVLLMAILGCVYLHIAKKSNDSNKASCPKLDVGILKRPVLIKGLLGIVSGTELAFLLMFIALLIWSFASFLHNGFATITPQLAAKDGQTM
ncbi:unnamed protein product [Lupinus luteus]|uniref:Uncharacterized protein n=1 Tax=Lupinus luteus TaxID=3873 RepID=A0AAV1X0M5_LUPLU